MTTPTPPDSGCARRCSAQPRLTRRLQSRDRGRMQPNASPLKGCSPKARAIPPYFPHLRLVPKKRRKKDPESRSRFPNSTDRTALGTGKAFSRYQVGPEAIKEKGGVPAELARFTPAHCPNPTLRLQPHTPPFLARRRAPRARSCPRPRWPRRRRSPRSPRARGGGRGARGGQAREGRPGKS